MKSVQKVYYAGLLMTLLSSAAYAQSTWTLDKVVSLTRHGVRPQTNTAKLDKATGLKWPKFLVSDGHLTGHGYTGMWQQGQYLIDQWQSEGLHIKQGQQCPNPQSYFLWSSPSQRIKASAKAVSDGMFAGCGIMPTSVKAKYGPLFELYHLHQAHPDHKVMKQQIMVRMGSPEQASMRYKDSVALLKRTVCAPHSCKFLDKPWGVHFKSTGKPALDGPGKYGATIGETIRLQYSDNLPLKDVAFGHGNNAKAVKALMSLHAAQYNLALDTPEFASHSGSLLMRQILSALSAKTSFATKYPGDPRLTRPLVMFFGHDTNVAEIQTMLGFNWILNGYPKNDIPPGGTLSFARFHNNHTGQEFVRVRFAAKSLNQWRTLSQLDGHHPLLHQDLSFNGCKNTALGTLCPLGPTLKRASRLLVKDGLNLAVFKSN